MPASDINLPEHMEELRSAIGDYAIQLVAWGNQRSGENFDAAKRALAPIDAARRAEARAAGAAEPATSDAPEGHGTATSGGASTGTLDGTAIPAGGPGGVQNSEGTTQV